MKLMCGVTSTRILYEEACIAIRRHVTRDEHLRMFIIHIRNNSRGIGE
jgi:hypothetical protein